MKDEKWPNEKTGIAHTANIPMLLESVFLRYYFFRLPKNGAISSPTILHLILNVEIKAPEPLAES